VVRWQKVSWEQGHSNPGKESRHRRGSKTRFLQHTREKKSVMSVEKITQYVQKKPVLLGKIHRP
jgi:hypothetical protein